MRQGQQNRRGRGRNQRKGHHQNPLTRTYESNGPDVKIRGTPAHIAEKYISLAREAMASGDPVLGESYLQHAEHYNRIIMTYREQQMQQSGEGMNGGMRPRPMPGAEPFDGGDEIGDEDGEESGLDGGQPSQIRGQEPQPQLEPFGREQRFDDRHQQRFDRPHRDDRPHREDRMHRQSGEGHGDRQHRQRFGERHDRGYGGERGEQQRFDRHDRQGRPERADRMERPDRPERQDRPDWTERDRDRPERAERGERPDRAERPERPERRMERAPERAAPERAGDGPPQAAVEPAAPVVAEAAAAPRRRGERFSEAQNDQPEFLRRPVRRPRREAAATEGEGQPAATVNDEPVRRGD